MIATLVKFRKLLAICALSATFGKAAGSPLVQNGSFETGDLSGWQVTSGTVLALASYGTTDGNYAAILGYGDSDGPNFTLMQTFATTAGTTYTLSFDWASAPNPTLQTTEVTVSGGAQPMLTQELAAIGAFPTPYSHYVYSFVADSSSSTLKFIDTSLSSYQSDQALDNVTLTAEVPEPATYLSLLIGLACLAYFTIYRTSRSQAQLTIKRKVTSIALVVMALSAWSHTSFAEEICKTEHLALNSAVNDACKDPATTVENKEFFKCGSDEDWMARTHLYFIEKNLTTWDKAVHMYSINQARLAKWKPNPKFNDSFNAVKHAQYVMGQCTGAAYMEKLKPTYEPGPEATVVSSGSENNDSREKGSDSSMNELTQALSKLVAVSSGRNRNTVLSSVAQPLASASDNYRERGSTSNENSAGIDVTSCAKLVEDDNNVLGRKALLNTCGFDIDITWCANSKYTSCANGFTDQKTLHANKSYPIEGSSTHVQFAACKGANSLSHVEPRTAFIHKCH